MSQADVVGLLTVGSAAAPKKELVGEEGQKSLVAVSQEGEKGLAAFFKERKNLGKEVLESNGLPPLPSGIGMKTKDGKERYELTEENAYPDE